MCYAPVALFAYRRAAHLERVIAGLKANPEAQETQLVVYCDGARDDASAADVARVRSFARAITGFKSVELVERKANLGLARSIVDGVTALCERHGRVIVLEDDVWPTPFFLRYVNSALTRYADEERVFSIGCFTFDTDERLPNTFFQEMPDCWGWGVWQRSWRAFEPDGAKLYEALRQRGLLRAFDLDGAYPYAAMLRDQVLGRNASWAVRWYASVFLAGGLALYPGASVTNNIGQDASGTHGGSKPLKPRLASAPIDVDAIAVEPSIRARQAWAQVLRRQRGGPAARATYAVRNRLALVWRAACKRSRRTKDSHD
jgi:hypothetical protein